MNRLSCNFIRIAAWSLGMASATAANAANLVGDGGFESPAVPDGSYTAFSSGQSFANWTVVGPGNVAVAGINSNSATGVQQVVATTPGQTYQLKFWVGNVIGGVYGTSSTVDVMIDGVQVKVATNSQGNGTKLTWQRFKLAFMATASSTTIQFINGDPTNDNSNGLDAVSLSAAKADVEGD